MVGSSKGTTVALLRTLFKSPTPASIDLLPKRFLQVFAAHDVDASQIPRLVPQIKYDDLQSHDRILAALTPALIDATANLFGIRRQWLEGLDDLIFYPFWARAQPKALLSKLSSAIAGHDVECLFPLRILTTSMDLERTSANRQLLVPIIVAPIGEGGEVVRWWSVTLTRHQIT